MLTQSAMRWRDMRAAKMPAGVMGHAHPMRSAARMPARMMSSAAVPATAMMSTAAVTTAVTTSGDCRLGQSEHGQY
ncbi:MAG TPA: hypothetical protein VHY20_05855 [Pirellulales bacterium]|nr:hypothetical protein [Pirellulales bacterium]